MSWESVKLSDIKEDSKDLGAGTYIFQIAPKSANYKSVPWATEQRQLSMRLTVVEGDERGRGYFLQFNDPASFDDPDKLRKMLQGLKKFQAILGVEPIEGEELDVYFNRVAQDHNPKFSATIAPAREYTDKKTKELKMGKPKFLNFSVKPAV